MSIHREKVMADSTGRATESGTTCSESKSKARAVTLDKALDALEVTFIALGKAGANGDASHPQREAWLAARKVLVTTGRVK